MVVPIMLPLVGFYFQLWVSNIWFDNKNTNMAILTMCGMVNATLYLLAFFVTIKYWKVDRLSAKTSSMPTQVFPYIWLIINIVIIICT